MHNGVDPSRIDHLGDDRIADVGAHKLSAADVLTRSHDIDPDDTFDRGIVGEYLRHAPAEVAGHAGDQNHLPHDGLLLVAALNAGLAQ